MSLHKGVVSGLWRSPPEILSQIFYHCLPESDHQLPSELQAPLLLTGVCRRWRAVAVDTPSIWSRLSVKVDLSHRQWEPQAFGYDLWLKRSRGYPLLLTLFCEETDAMKIRSLLQPCIRQSRHSVTFGREVYQPELLLHDLPALQELAIQEGRNSYGHLPVIPRSITRLPRTLRSLKVVDRCFITMRLTSFGPVMTHLTNFDIATLQQPGAIFHLLQLCPNLSSLKIYVRFGYRLEDLESFPHLKIQTLHIRRQCSLAGDLSSLFNALSLSSLRVLEDHCNNGVPCFHEQLRAFLARSRCPLQNLVFGGWNIPAVTNLELEEYLDIIPSLKIRLEEDHTQYSY
ncbi:uncharacterized protein F5147DRAFT_214011 [Suillus discolor]|uniref:F-box domain-containing protein n=1 Tax=Suillus discolor TaxID=1912936 RepID=A0A9P7F6Y9_9AGAM|nr:uncharacterized protein F5147DRAFT_214011 [Suillus discolor]KAG2107296.1 hypothetical protein F5147DRAFT_214011 [Suillus discolor]